MVLSRGDRSDYNPPISASFTCSKRSQIDQGREEVSVDKPLWVSSVVVGWDFFSHRSCLATGRSRRGTLGDSTNQEVKAYRPVQHCVTSEVDARCAWRVTEEVLAVENRSLWVILHGEGIVSFPLPPRAHAEHAIKEIILSFNRVVLLPLTPQPQWWQRHHPPLLLLPYLPDRTLFHLIHCAAPNFPWHHVERCSHG